MNVLIVLANPEPRSFCHALAETARTALSAEGHTVAVSDLFAQGFNPVAGRHDFRTVADPERFHYQTEQSLAARNDAFCDEIAAEQRKVSKADILIPVFPMWWGGPPAIFKGWLERVLAYGFAYVDGYRFETGLFRGRRAMICVTTGGTDERFSGDGVYGPIGDVLYPVRRLALEYMGYEVADPFVAYAAPRVSHEARQALLSTFAEQAAALARRPVQRFETETHPLDLVPEGAWGRS